MKTGIAICGDPRRKPLANALFEIYSTYDQWVDEVRLYFRKNPAEAFNAAAREMNIERFIGIAGDLFVGEYELRRFSVHPSPVACCLSPLTPRRRDIIPYPRPWIEKPWSFTTGLFKAPRKLIEEVPFPEWPSFCEDYLWEKLIRPLGYEPAIIQVPCVHVDHHFLIRGRNFVYLSLPGRFRNKTLKEDAMEIIKMFAFEWQEVWAAIRDDKQTIERHFP